MPLAPPPTYIGGAPVTCGVDTSLTVPFPESTASAQDRPATSSDLDGFIAAFASFNGIPKADVSIVPGTPRVADMPAIKTQWGLATFTQSPTASPIGAGSNAFKPPYNMLAFVRQPGCPWGHFGPLFVPFPCPNAKSIPVGVQRAWHIKSQSAEACSAGYAPPAPR